MLTYLIANNIQEAFFGGNWSEADFKKALSGVDFQMAQTQVPITENTIAKLINHLRYNNEMMVNRANGIRHEFDEKESFAAPILNSEEDWQNMVGELFSTAEILIGTVRNFDEEKLNGSIYTDFQDAYRNFQGISEHCHYHLGQIVLIKKYLEIISE